MNTVLPSLSFQLIYTTPQKTRDNYFSILHLTPGQRKINKYIYHPTHFELISGVLNKASQMKNHGRMANCCANTAKQFRHETNFTLSSRFYAMTTHQVAKKN